MCMDRCSTNCNDAVSHLGGNNEHKTWVESYYNIHEGTKVQNPRRLCHVHVYRPIANIHGNMHTRTNRECTGKYTEIWQRQKL